MALTIVRRDGESVEIGNAVITVRTGNYRGKVKLTIEAPRDVVIMRSELLEGEARENPGRDAGERSRRR